MKNKQSMKTTQNLAGIFCLCIYLMLQHEIIWPIFRWSIHTEQKYECNTCFRSHFLLDELKELEYFVHNIYNILNIQTVSNKMINRIKGVRN